MSTEKADKIYQALIKIFPDAKCELDYRNLFELIVAVVLSAQTTDKRVNMVTPDLFNKYPTCQDLAKADPKDVSEIIASLGLFRTKAKNIILMSQKLVDEYDGQVPNKFEDLISLPGVGRKTANVVLSEGFRIPAIAVDTHVSRVAQKLGLSNSNDVLQIEEDLKKHFDRKDWSMAHHLLLHFGRYICTARNPHYELCPFDCECHKKTK